MPEFKSEAHREKFQQLLEQKKISQSDFDKYQKATGSKKLPARLTSKAPKGGRR